MFNDNKRDLQLAQTCVAINGNLAWRGRFDAFVITTDMVLLNLAWFSCCRDVVALTWFVAASCGGLDGVGG